MAAQLKTERTYRSYGSLGEERLSAIPGGLSTPHVYPAVLARKAYRALHLGFVALVVMAGIDKFFNGLTEWARYLDPVFPSALGVTPTTFLWGVGVLEVVLGIGLTLKPRIFADAFSLWLTVVTVNLLVQGEYFDVALFNFALAAGACALARLSKSEELNDFGTLVETGGSHSIR